MEVGDVFIRTFFRPVEVRVVSPRTGTTPGWWLVTSNGELMWDDEEALLGDDRYIRAPGAMGRLAPAGEGKN